MGIGWNISDWESLEQWRIITVVSVVALLILGLAIYSVFHALRHVRSSQAAVAWTIGLILLPLIALPLYWVFARDRFEGYREAIREVGGRHQQSVQALQRELLTERYARTTDQDSALERVADVLDTPLSFADQSELLIDGIDFFDAALKAVDGARSYVYLAFYIIRDDEIGRRVAGKLAELTARGVKVRVLYDEVGCLRLPTSYLARLRRAGVDVRAFNTRQGWVNRFQINFRNHRKLVVVDGETAIVGGFNIGDEYVGESAGRPKWRDTAVQVVGPVTRKVQAVFARDYYWAAREDLPEADWSNQDIEPRDSRPYNAAVCATGPADLRPRASMMFAAIAGAARERLWISTPYLVPDESSTVALHMAKSRGVDVRLLIPTEADHLGVYLAGFHYEQEFAEAGIPVYRYRSGFMHQKCILVDDQLALIGSTNLDCRSIYLNFELMLAVADAGLVADVTEMLQRDFADAKHSNAPDVPVRWWYERAGTAVARLFSPVL